MVVTCLDVSIIYFISCDCIVNPSLSYTIYYDPLNDEYPQQCVVRHNLSSVRSRTRHLTINDKQDMLVVKSILIK